MNNEKDDDDGDAASQQQGAEDEASNIFIVESAATADDSAKAPPLSPSSVRASATAQKSSVAKEAALVEKKKRARIPAKYKLRKPIGMPQRPLSAYNYFFSDERAKILDERKRMQESGSAVTAARAEPTKGEEGRRPPGLFESMAKTVAARWKEVSPEAMARYSQLAEQDLQRYRSEMEEYNRKIVEDHKKDLKNRKEDTQKRKTIAIAPVTVDGALVSMAESSESVREVDPFPSRGLSAGQGSAAAAGLHAPLALDRIEESLEPSMTSGNQSSASTSLLSGSLDATSSAHHQSQVHSQLQQARSMQQSRVLESTADVSFLSRFLPSRQTAFQLQHPTDQTGAMANFNRASHLYNASLSFPITQQNSIALEMAQAAAMNNHLSRLRQQQQHHHQQQQQQQQQQASNPLINFQTSLLQHQDNQARLNHSVTQLERVESQQNDVLQLFQQQRMQQEDHRLGRLMQLIQQPFNQQAILPHQPLQAQSRPEIQIDASSLLRNNIDDLRLQQLLALMTDPEQQLRLLQNNQSGNRSSGNPDGSGPF